MRQSTANRLRCAVDSATLWIYSCSLAAAALASDGAGTLSHTSLCRRHLELTRLSFLCADGSAESDAEAAASTAMLTVMPAVVVPCLVGGYWLPKLFARCRGRQAWDDDKHGKGTAVMLKSDKRRGVSTKDRDDNGEIRVRFDDGSEDWIKTDDVLAVEAGAGPLRCACQCSRGKVDVKQTVVDSDGGSTKTRGSYWTKAFRAGQSYYFRWQTAGLKVKESTLVLPKEAVLRTEEQVELTAFEEGLAEAERMDALRDAGQLNLGSPWTKAAHGDRAYYWRNANEGDSSEATLLVPAEGLKAVQMLDAEDFERGFARAERLDELRSAETEQMDALRDAGQLNLESPWTKVINGERTYYGRGGDYIQHHDLQSQSGGDTEPEELLLELPAEGVNGVRASGAEDFERGFAEAERMDALRTTLAPAHLNLESPWMRAVDDEGLFYWRAGPREIVSEPPEEGVKGDSGRLRREDLIEWDAEKHGEGTEVILKRDGRRGVSTMSALFGGIQVRFDDDGSVSGWSTDDVLAAARWG